MLETLWGNVSKQLNKISNKDILVFRHFNLKMLHVLCLRVLIEGLGTGRYGLGTDFMGTLPKVFSGSKALSHQDLPVCFYSSLKVLHLHEAPMMSLVLKRNYRLVHLW